MKKYTTQFIFFILLFTITLPAQEANFDWESNVWLPGRGMETVVVNDTTLFHLGGKSPYGVIFDDPFNSFLEYKNPSDLFWQLTNVKLKFRRYIDAHFYNGHIYVLGGDGYPVSDSTLEIIDVNTLEVTYGANFPDPRNQAGSVIYNGKIYVFGGMDHDYSTGTSAYKTTLYIYDCDMDTWTQGADFPFAGVINQAGVYNGMIYSFGGYDGSTSDIIYVYDIANDVWMQKGTTPQPTSAISVAVYGEDIFVIGDYAEENRFWKYNVPTETWTSYTSNLIGRRHSSVAVMNDRLYVIGGVAKNSGAYRFLNIVQSTDLTQLVTSAEKEELSAINFSLEQNYPNPFNPTTKINFSIPSESKVQLKIFDSLGRLVKTILNEELAAGNHTIDFDASSLSSGVYFYQLNVNNKWVQSRKMTLLK